LLVSHLLTIKIDKSKI